MVDESASIKTSQWNTLIPFLEKIIESLDLDSSDIRLSLTTFSTPVRSLFTFLDKASHQTDMALAKLRHMHETKPPSGMTYTGQALTYVRNFVLPFGRKNAPKAVLLITDGDSSDPDLTSQAAAMLRDDGVTLLVVGVGDINVNECRGIVGCDRRMECPLFVHTQWDNMIGMVNRLMADVCETVAEDAVCEPQWSDWSECMAECHSSGTRLRKLLSMVTKKHATVGSNGQQGRACNEQYGDFPPPAEPCYRECNDSEGYNHNISTNNRGKDISGAHAESNPKENAPELRHESDSHKEEPGNHPDSTYDSIYPPMLTDEYDNPSGSLGESINPPMLTDEYDNPSGSLDESMNPPMLTDEYDNPLEPIDGSNYPVEETDDSNKTVNSADGDTDSYSPEDGSEQTENPTNASEVSYGEQYDDEGYYDETDSDKEYDGAVAPETPISGAMPKGKESYGSMYSSGRPETSEDTETPHHPDGLSHANKIDSPTAARNAEHRLRDYSQENSSDSEDENAHRMFPT